jgi:hypothetical protein
MAARPPRPGIAALAFFALFLALYFAVATRFAGGRMFGRAGLVLGTDAPRVIADLTRYDANHYRTKVHPLFVILLNPPGTLLKEWIGQPRVGAMLLNSGFAALGVALFHLLLRLWGVAAGRASLWTVLFGLSASQIFFGSLPETYAFSGAALLLLYVLFAAGLASGARFVAAGVFAFGMTVTHLALAVWLRARCVAAGGGLWALAPRLVRYTAAVAAVTAGLGMLQALWYPRARLFFGPAALREEAQYVFLPESASALAARAADVVANAFVFNLAAPALQVDKAGHRYPKTSFPPPSPAALRPTGVAHGLLWSALLWAAAACGARHALHRHAAVQALLGGVAFHLALHSVYGEALFLYSCHWTFGVLASAALAIERGLVAQPAWTRRATVVLVALAALQAANNAAFLYELYSIYR